MWHFRDLISYLQHEKWHTDDLANVCFLHVCLWLGKAQIIKKKKTTHCVYIVTEDISIMKNVTKLIATELKTAINNKIFLSKIFLRTLKWRYLWVKTQKHYPFIYIHILMYECSKTHKHFKTLLTGSLDILFTLMYKCSFKKNLISYEKKYSLNEVNQSGWEDEAKCVCC